MIRHIVISHQLKDTPTIKEAEQKKNKIEETFQHSESMHKLYRKVD